MATLLVYFANIWRWWLCCLTPLSIIYQGGVVTMIVWWLDLQLPIQSVPITTDIVNSNLDQGEVYNRPPRYNWNQHQINNKQTIFQLYRGISFIGGGNRSTWRKPQTCCKSLINLITSPTCCKSLINLITWCCILKIGKKKLFCNSEICNYVWHVVTDTVW